VALALMVCVISIATLNYFRPHKSSIVFSVAQASFLLTALKYLVAIILEGMKNSKDREEFGAFLILVDVCFVVASLFSMATVGYLFIKNIGGDVAPKVKVKAGGLQKVHPSLNLEHTHIELAVQKNSDSDNNNNNNNNNKSNNINNGALRTRTRDNTEGRRRTAGPRRAPRRAVRAPRGRQARARRHHRALARVACVD
jgi:hypothetical protein